MKGVRSDWAETYTIKRGLGRGRQLRALARHVGLVVENITELGVYRGALTRKLRAAFPLASLTLVDAWASLRPTGHINQGTSPREWEEIYAGLRAEFPKAVFHRMLTHAAVAFVPDDSQDLIYVDADHTYPSVREDIEDWLPKLRAGGIMCGHDYHPGTRRNGVAQAVHERFGEENVLRLPFMCWATVKGDPRRQTYGPSFFARRPGKFRERQRPIADMLYRLFQPRRAFDVGCGIGSYLERFAELGCEVGGVDRWAQNAREFIPERIRGLVKVADAGRLINGELPSDLVLCLEVAEHLPESAAPVLAGNLRALCERKGHVVFSAAEPGSRGRGHVHLKPADWWRALLEWSGLSHSPEGTERLQAELFALGDPLDYGKRIMVFDGPC